MSVGRGIGRSCVLGYTGPRFGSKSPTNDDMESARRQMTDTNPQARVTVLQARGVTVFDPAQVYVGSEVCPERIAPGSILFPGTRLHGSRTFLAPRSKVGSEGPATVIDSVLGEEAEIASGYIANSVVLN